MTDLKKEILLGRHGTSERNEVGMYQTGDQFNTDMLSQQGEAEAQLLASEFESQKYKPDVIVSSYYRRAIQTALPISLITGACIVVPVYDENWHVHDVSLEDVKPADGKSLLRELDLPSELAGLLYDNPEAKRIKKEIRNHLYDPDWHYSNEENLHDIWHRAGAMSLYLSARHEKKIYVQTHGGMLKAFLAHVLFNEQEGWDMRQKLKAYQAFTSGTWVDNTGIVSIFQLPDGSWQWPISYNRHLSSSFGFMNNEPSPGHDTPADELHQRRNGGA